MKRFSNLSYRFKLMISYTGIVTLVALAITVILSLAATSRATNDNKAHLSLLTEQVLINFTKEMDDAEQYLASATANMGVASQMYNMRNDSAEDSKYIQRKRELIYRISTIITAQAPYDNVLVRLSNGEFVTTAFANIALIREAKSLLSDEIYGANHYGEALWVRSASGQLFLIRDVYSTSPLHHVGKIAVSIRQETLADLGSYNDLLRCALLFFDSGGQYITSTGEMADGLEQAALIALNNAQSDVYANGERYIATVHSNGTWSAVGFLPMTTIENVRTAIVRSSLAVAVLGVLVGLLVVAAVTKHMSGQISTMVNSMDKVASGDMNLAVPVESNDEIGQLAIHFNRMTEQTRELLLRVVQEETRKRQAEFQVLEYKYRSLQSQINPHFINNALETVNALAKLDGNAEICEVIRHISAYFRQNTQNIQKKFISVRCEFDSLKEYASIYCHIHGDSLRTLFACTDDASDALVPTMILQPLLENALTHGVRSSTTEAIVGLSARTEGETELIVEISDNGNGISKETADRILYGEADSDGADAKNTAGIGMRNVRDRLRLIFGKDASIGIENREGGGTLVIVRIPLLYEEPELL